MALQEAMQQFEFQMSQTNWAVEPDRFKPLRHKSKGAIAEDFILIAGP